ncbi:DNA-directed RNA polymerase, mitochondrial isoform X1 [Elephas maximus indicus]|uniref:DNA-directed RNA polymerase, mitochondrial isoform X1 n=1 Tax=Elephas maximus indicus TaxID=99487 RepID=UPI002116F533|nr:DNA-directed RNA polymerase, mitochondrial isoform X1 [Elephas maximus indicus]
MSALSWGRGAAGLGRVLVPAGRPGLVADAGAGALGGIWGRRRSSSASPCERDRRKDWGHAELLEVLEARVRQLQAESVSEVTVKRVDVTRIPEGSGGSFQSSRKAKAGAAPELRGRWAEKLDKEKWIMQKRKQQLEVKLKAHMQKLPRERQLRPLRVEPRLQNGQLAGCLQRWARGSPDSPWEKQLAQALQETPRKLSREEAQALANREAKAQLSGQQQKLLAFLKCCLLTDHVPLAHHVLVTQHGNFRRRRQLTLAMYNTVMLGWARKGSFKELVYVFFMVKDAGLTPDLLSYAAALQCMGRLDQDAETIKRCLEQMARDRLQLQKLFSAVPMSKDEQAALLTAVRKVKPAFSPPPRPAPQVNISPLLRDVYAQGRPVSYPKLHLPLKTLEDLFQQQLRVELATTVQVQSVDKAPPLTSEVLHARETLRSLQAQWEAALCQELQEIKANLARTAHGGRPTLYPHLCLLSERQMAQMLLQVLQVLPPQGESLIHLAHELGMRTFNRYVVQRKQREHQVQALQRRYSEYLRLLACDTQVDPPRLPRQHWEMLGGPGGEPPPEQPWPLPVLLQLGKQLAEVLVRAVHMPRNLGAPAGKGAGTEPLIPVLYHVYSFRSVRQIGVLKPHPAFSQLLAAAAEPTLTFEAAEVPMLCPPLPWTSPHSGAFLLSPAKLMRAVEGTMLHQQRLEHCPPAALHGAFDALTQLGNCAWRVNGRVLDLVLELFHAHGCTRLGVPPPASDAPCPPARRPPPGTPPARLAELRREAARCLKAARELRSLRADALYRLSLAQHLRHHGAFWLPHNMDFRGRTYPCPPHLSHLGSDLARALLEFAQGCPLGPHGLDWLKLHLVNLTGLKKRESLQARLAFADQVLDEVLDSADRPMTGRKWWMEADEPWQTLACCMELARALRSPDPTSFVSHFPVHQDGSCNGLQHYAALGRDSVGAASVNLTPSDLPQDVYSGVAAQVEVFRRQDAERGVRVAQVLEGFVSRKVVKQTVMTVVYGVTRYGGRLQIEKRLRELPDFPQEFVWEASHYLVRQVFNSLQEMFSATRAIQHWLTESARLISHTGSAVEWVTPLGIPIIQPYHRISKFLIKGGIQSMTFNHSSDSSQRPNTLKQKNGFPPNFIHSLDSSHMMLTALHCYRKGLTFVSVHDCFWTHAADVPVMNQVCREQFVRLHSQPILRDLSRFLVKRFCSAPRSQNLSKNAQTRKLFETLLALPETGDFDLEQVKQSTYFFS